MFSHHAVLTYNTRSNGHLRVPPSSQPAGGSRPSIKQNGFLRPSLSGSGYQYNHTPLVSILTAPSHHNIHRLTHSIPIAKKPGSSFTIKTLYLPISYKTHLFTSTPSKPPPKHNHFSEVGHQSSKTKQTIHRSPQNTIMPTNRLKNKHAQSKEKGKKKRCKQGKQVRSTKETKKKKHCK